MGVAGLHVWLRAHFGSCFTHHRWTTGQTESKDEWSRVEGVGVDLGGELHHLCQQSAGTHELFFFQRLHERLDAILLRLRPLRSAVLAVDGPGIKSGWLKMPIDSICRTANRATTQGQLPSGQNRDADV